MCFMNRVEFPSPTKVGQLLLFADRVVGDLMSGRMGQDFAPPYTAIGILGADGQLCGGMLFNAYVEGDVEVTCYAPGRLLRGPIRAGCAYAFETLGCNRLSARTRASSLAVQVVLRKIGFQQEGYARSYLRINGAWHDHLLFGLLAEDWRRRRERL